MTAEFDHQQWNAAMAQADLHPARLQRVDAHSGEIVRYAVWVCDRRIGTVAHIHSTRSYAGHVKGRRQYRGHSAGWQLSAALAPGGWHTGPGSGQLHVSTRARALQILTARFLLATGKVTVPGGQRSALADLLG